MYIELASIREVVDLSPQAALDSAETFVAKLGYETLQRTDTSLTVKRDEPGRRAKSGVPFLRVTVLPQPEGGVQVKVRGTDQEGMRQQQAEWRQWVESLPKKEPEGLDKTIPLREPEDQTSNGNSEGEGPNAITEELEPREPLEGEESSYVSEGKPARKSVPAVYEYKMIPVSLSLVAEREGDQGGAEVAQQLQSVANAQAEQGWEFYRVDALGFSDSPGRLRAFFRGGQRQHYVATFRRPK